MVTDAAQDGGSWLSDLWKDTKEVLTDGMSIWQDVEAIKNPPIMTANSPSGYRDPFQPVDQQTIANAQVKTDAWVPGVSNKTVIVGGVALAIIVVLAVKS